MENLDKNTIEEFISRWNPHFVDVSKGKWIGKIKRERYLNKLQDLLEIRHVIILSGIRRAGKSTIMQQMIQYLIEEKKVNPINLFFVQLEDILLAPYLKEGSNLLEYLYTYYKETYNPQGKVYLFLDEIQSIKDFNKWIFSRYEADENIKFIISGSRQSLIESETATVLTGRNIQIDVYPLSFYEYLQVKSVLINPGQDLHDLYRKNVSQSAVFLYHLNNFLYEGGFPEVVLTENKEIKRDIINAYYSDMIGKDIIKPNSIRNTEEIEILGLQILSDFTKTHTYSSLGRPQKLSVDVVKNYLSYFSKAYLFFESTFFSYKTKETQDIQKPRKIYVVDNGMRNFNVVSLTPDLGQCAENAVYIELRKNYKTVYYWKGRKEVDFIIKQKDIELLNVSYTDNIHTREIESLIEGLEEFNLNQGSILTRNHMEIKEVDHKKIHFIPLWLWLIAKAVNIKNTL